MHFEALYKRLLSHCVKENGLQAFYPPDSISLNNIASRAAQQVGTFAQQWRINTEVAPAIVQLALYQVILYIDDSGSMAFEEDGERIDDLKLIMSRIAFATSLFDGYGIQARFMHSTTEGNAIKSHQEVDQLIKNTKFSGLTPTGRELEKKILKPLVVRPANSRTLQKPVLVIIITDGCPTGERQDDVARFISNARTTLRHSYYGEGALAVQCAQVGHDPLAQRFLARLEESSIGHSINCVSSKPNPKPF